MGIVNVNDDSFSGDGTLDAGEAHEQACAQGEAGADIVRVSCPDQDSTKALTDLSLIHISEPTRLLSIS